MACGASNFKPFNLRLASFDPMQASFTNNIFYMDTTYTNILTSLLHQYQ
jgi:hypothetical protein